MQHNLRIKCFLNHRWRGDRGEVLRHIPDPGPLQEVHEAAGGILRIPAEQEKQKHHRDTGHTSLRLCMCFTLWSDSFNLLSLVLSGGSEEHRGGSCSRAAAGDFWRSPERRGDGPSDGRVRRGGNLQGGWRTGQIREDKRWREGLMHGTRISPLSSSVQQRAGGLFGNHVDPFTMERGTPMPTQVTSQRPLQIADSRADENEASPSYVNYHANTNNNNTNNRRWAYRNNKEKRM